MPYVFSETQAGEPRSAAEFPSLTSEVLEETFAQTFEENPIAATVRAADLARDYRTGRQLDAASARQKLADRGMENDIAINDAGITEDALDTLMFRKGVEKRRQEVYGLAEGGFAQGAARLGVGLATSLVDPVGVATAFIPVIGGARYANMLGRAGGLLGRTAVRAGAGAVEGAAGAALVEPFISGSRRYEQADYDMADSLLNVAFGGLFGAGLHSVGGAVSDGVRAYRGTEPVWRGLENLTPDESQLVLNLRSEIERGMDSRDIARATETWSEPMRKAVESDVPKATPAEVFHQSLPPITRELALKQAIVQGISDEPVNVQPIIRAAEARQTETPEFKRWFGESRVVDEAGQPARVYHGTASDFDAFDVSLSTDGTVGRAIYVTEQPRFADQFAQGATGAQGSPNIMPLYVRAERPVDLQGVVTAADVQALREVGAVGDKFSLNVPMTHAQLLDFLKDKFGGVEAAIAKYREAGFDSFRFRKPDGETAIAVFDQNQVKSAIGNSGRFDQSSASLTDPMTDVAKATEYAEKVLARVVDTDTPTADALKMATEEASLAQSDLKALAERLGEEVEDAELREVLDAAANADRWARAAELATVCLVRGG